MTLLMGQFSTPKVIFKYIPDWCIVYIMVINNSFSIIKNEISIITVNKTKWQNHNCPIRKWWWNNWKFIKCFIKKMFYLNVYMYTYTENLYNCIITHTCTYTHVHTHIPGRWFILFFIIFSIKIKVIASCFYLFIFVFSFGWRKFGPSISSLCYMTQGF